MNAAPVLALALTALGIVACAAESATDAPAPGPTSAGVDGGSASKKPPAADTPLSIPFYVSDEFAPSGYMGDGDANIKGIQMTTDVSACKAPRAPDANGDCYAVRWTPVVTPPATGAWAGVYWQYPTNNWGGVVGRKVAPGATRVVFYAAGEKGGEAVTFRAGGVNVKGGDPTLTNKDSFAVSTDVTLEAGWKRYELSLGGATYETVIGAFAWVASVKSATPVAFYVDDVRWER